MGGSSLNSFGSIQKKKTKDNNLSKFLPLIKFPGLCDIKKVEMGTKYRKLVPPEQQGYWLYKVPDKEMIAKQNKLKQEAKKKKRNTEINHNAKKDEGYYLTGTVICKKIEDGKHY